MKTSTTMWRLQTTPAFTIGPKHRSASTTPTILPSMSSTTHRRPEAKAVVEGREEAKAKAKARGVVINKAPTYKG